MYVNNPHLFYNSKLCNQNPRFSNHTKSIRPLPPFEQTFASRNMCQMQVERSTSYARNYSPLLHHPISRCPKPLVHTLNLTWTAASDPVRSCGSCCADWSHFQRRVQYCRTPKGFQSKRKTRNTSRMAGISVSVTGGDLEHGMLEEGGVDRFWSFVAQCATCAAA